LYAYFLTGIQINFLHVHSGGVTGPVPLFEFLFSQTSCVRHFLNLLFLAKQLLLQVARCKDIEEAVGERYGDCNNVDIVDWSFVVNDY
jgi:hypothetical protein